MIHREFRIFEQVFGLFRIAAAERKPDRGCQEYFPVAERDRAAQRLANGLGECGDARGIAFRQHNHAELVAGEPRQRVLRLDQPAEPARQSQQNGIADRHADRVVDLFESVDIDHQHGRTERGVRFGEPKHRLEPVEKQFAIRQSGQVIVNGVVEEPLLRGLELGDVGDRANQPDHLAVRADDRARPQGEPQIMAIGGAHAEILHDASAALFEHAVERGAEAVAVGLMQHVEPFGCRTFKRAMFETERRLGLRAREHLVGGHVPVPDHVAGAGQCQRPAFDIGDDAARHSAARERVLHHGEADQHDDQHKPAEQRRSDNVVGDEPEYGQGRADDPNHEKKPGRDQHHRAIVIVGREVNDERKAKHRDQE